MILRLSQKLNAKIKAGELDAKPLDENPYADWSCHLFTVRRTQYILISNTVSLYSCVMYGAGITDDGIFIKRALDTIREFLDDAGQQFVYHKFIVPSTATIWFAKSLNRTVTGSMTELIHHAKLWIEEDDLSPEEVSFRLDDILLSALGTGASRDRYGKPVQAFQQLGSLLS